MAKAKYTIDDPRFKSEICPNKKKHTKCPEGYIDFFDWAEKKSKTHRQIRCKGCKLFMIWVPKKKKS